MTKYINKDRIVAEIEEWRDKIRMGIFSIPLSGKDATYATFEYEVLGKVITFLDIIEVKEVDLTDRKLDWSPSKKQMESLHDMLQYNIGVFDYQKFMEVNSLYDDLTKISDYGNDRQK